MPDDPRKPEVTDETATSEFPRDDEGPAERAKFTGETEAERSRALLAGAKIESGAGAGSPDASPTAAIAHRAKAAVAVARAEIAAAGSSPSDRATTAPRTTGASRSPSSTDASAPTSTTSSAGDGGPSTSGTEDPAKTDTPSRAGLASAGAGAPGTLLGLGAMASTTRTPKEPRQPDDESRDGHALRADRPDATVAVDPGEPPRAPTHLTDDDDPPRATSRPVSGSIAARTRVTIGNPADGGVFYWLGKLTGFLVIATLVVATFAGICTYSYFSVNAPPIPDLRNYAKIAPSVTEMYAADGTKLGEFAKEHRELVPFEKMPKQLVDAFLAVEDHDFFNHRGLYFKGVARAAWINVTAGDFAQGGSTITQQVAKQFLGSEKSLSRKGFEAVIARRLEARYSKKAILSVYLNHIYLGAGAWGVGAAAHRYFGKTVEQLSLAEAALIAGLAKAPTKFSPTARPELARERRNVVLDKMATYKFATPEQIATAKAEPITLHSYRELFPDRMPYYAEHVRRYVLDKYKKAGLFESGFRIETAAEPVWEAAAYENTDFSARHQDKRQGWRGPEWRVDGLARETFLARARVLYGGTEPLDPDRRYLALVDKVSGDGAVVLVGDRRLQLPARNLRWGARWQAGNAENDKTVDSAREVLKPGYVVWVQRETRTLARYRDWHLPDTKNPSWRGRDDQSEWDAKNTDVVVLEQVPHPQSTIFTADHHNGHVVAMVGGYDYDRSVFNRAVQACRQPGSTYKPIYYALGLQEGYGFDTVLNDVPVTIVDPDTGETWSPTNLGDSLDGDVTLEYALVYSKNIPSVDLFQRLSKPPLGSKDLVEKWIRSLGYSTKLFIDDALALGASCSKLDEMARAFTVFARNGAWWPRPTGSEKNWVYVRRILDRDGSTVEDNTLVDDPMLVTGDRFDRFAAVGGIVPVQAIPARPAFLMTKLLAAEVEYGFANVLRATEVPAAGKTGTSSATHDTMFIAYTPKYTTLVWLGDDKKERALGKFDAAFMTVVPAWSRYMYEATKSYPKATIPWAVPPGVNPRDRGDHTKGKHGPQMDLVFRAPPKKNQDGEGDDTPPGDGPTPDI